MMTMALMIQMKMQASIQLSLDDFVKPADWPDGKNWGTLTIEASCTPSDITYPTDLRDTFVLSLVARRELQLRLGPKLGPPEKVSPESASTKMDRG